MNDIFRLALELYTQICLCSYSFLSHYEGRIYNIGEEKTVCEIILLAEEKVSIKCHINVGEEKYFCRSPLLPSSETVEA